MKVLKRCAMAVAGIAMLMMAVSCSQIADYDEAAEFDRALISEISSILDDVSKDQDLSDEEAGRIVTEEVLLLAEKYLKNHEFDKKDLVVTAKDGSTKVSVKYRYVTDNGRRITRSFSVSMGSD